MARRFVVEGSVHLIDGKHDDWWNSGPRGKFPRVRTIYIADSYEDAVRSIAIMRFAGDLDKFESIRVWDNEKQEFALL